jgi:hypothetical protein
MRKWGYWKFLFANLFFSWGLIFIFIETENSRLTLVSDVVFFVYIVHFGFLFYKNFSAATIVLFASLYPIVGFWSIANMH